MLASHNTLTYLPPRRWWARLFRPFWQCQDKTAAAQYAAGARRMDIRIRRTHRGTWRPCHGIIDLGTRDYPSLRALLQAHNIYPREELSLRIVLERVNDLEADTHFFKQLLAYACIEGYIIAEAAIKSPWQCFLGPDSTPTVDHYHKPLDTARPWYAQLPSLIRALWTTPRRYAQLHPIPPEHRSDPSTLHYHDFI